MANPPRGAARLRADKTAAIRRAVFEELAAHGWAGVTVEAIAARARVGKPAIYRRWPSKREMILDCLVSVGVNAALPDNTGRLRDDLLGFTRQAAALLADPLAGRVISAVLSAISTHPELAGQMANRFRAPRRQAAREAFQRAIGRGEIGPDTDIELATDLLAGPFYMHALRLEGTIPANYAERVTDAAIRSCAPAPNPRP